MTLYLLLRHASKNAGSAMVILVAIDTAIVCLNMVFQFAGLLVATEESYAAAFGTEGANALVLLMFDMQHDGYLIAQIFFGLWLFPLGILAKKSGMFPRLLGIPQRPSTADVEEGNTMGTAAIRNVKCGSAGRARYREGLK